MCVAGYQFDYVYDWTILKYQQAQKSKTQPQFSVGNLDFKLLYEEFL